MSESTKKEVRTTDQFDEWLDGLRDHEARGRIVLRIERLGLGNPGDWNSVGGGVREMRLTYGPGYRLYYVERGRDIVILLCGGEKSTQDRDVAVAKKLAAALKGPGEG